MRSDRPFISVIIPTYDRPAATLAAIDSARAQSFHVIEIIVVDDASPSPFVLTGPAADDPRISVIHHPANRGPAGARNTGVHAARGAWIAFLDSDDLWRRDKLAQQMLLLDNADPEITAVACGFRKTDARDGSAIEQTPRPARDPALFASGCWHCPGTTALVGKAAFDRVGPFDERLRRLEDLDWYLRFGCGGGELKVAPAVLADVRVGGRPVFSTVDRAADLILRKFDAGDIQTARDPATRQRLAAYLDLERAAAAWTERPGSPWRRLCTAGYLARSWLRRPRTRLHLENFWASA